MSTIRRLLLLPKQSMLFKVMAPQMLIWGYLQIFYMTVHGISKTNFGIHPVLLSLSNLTSSIILGSSIPQLIVSWIAIYKKSSNIGDFNYQKQYWVVVCVVILLSIVLEILVGVDTIHYVTYMRLIFILWTLFLAASGIILLYYGVTIYNLIPNTGDANTLRARRYIPILIGCLCCGLFPTMCVMLMFYASYVGHIESSKWLPLFIWASLWSGSCIYVGFWSIYFYITTTNQLHDIKDTSSKSSTITRNTSRTIDTPVAN